MAKLLSAGSKDATILEKDLASMRAEQKRLARAVATAGDDIPELVAELRLRNDRIRRLEADLAASRRTPAMVADVLANAETAARTKLADLRTALTAAPPAMREVFQSLFLEGLIFRRWLLRRWRRSDDAFHDGRKCDPRGDSSLSGALRRQPWPDADLHRMSRRSGGRRRSA